MIGILNWISLFIRTSHRYPAIVRKLWKARVLYWGTAAVVFITIAPIMGTVLLSLLFALSSANNPQIGLLVIVEVLVSCVTAFLIWSHGVREHCLWIHDLEIRIEKHKTDLEQAMDAVRSGQTAWEPN